MEEKARVGFPDTHMLTKAGNKKKRKASNDVRGPVERRRWLVH